MKYDAMIAVCQEKSKEKMGVAYKQIQRMLESGEKITVVALVRYTGFSKGFFYRNKEMRPAVENARKNQVMVCNTMETIEKHEMGETIINLKIDITKLKMENMKLEDENQQLVNRLQAMEKELLLLRNENAKLRSS